MFQFKTLFYFTSDSYHISEFNDDPPGYLQTVNSEAPDVHLVIHGLETPPPKYDEWFSKDIIEFPSIKN